MKKINIDVNVNLSLWSAIKLRVAGIMHKEFCLGCLKKINGDKEE